MNHATSPQPNTAPAEIVVLVERFRQQSPAYRAGRYNETQLRRDFLDPLFEALGWDVSNRKNYSERFREVIHEVSVEVGGQARAADYAFQSGGGVLFFLEAKKPSINIETDPEPAFQIRRYAWSAKLPVSLLSDFEHLAVYDTRVKPVQGDPAHIGRVRLYHYSDYVEKWDEIHGLLSYQAVHQGSLERLVENIKAQRGTADVDDDFLEKMERWRELLARNIALRNPGLNTREINRAVQMTIDRIIFLRICEDRGIEPENALRDATDGIDVYGDLLALFRQADRKYNSGLFHFNPEKGRPTYPDTLTPAIRVDDKPLKDVLADLYYPRSPYAFKYIPADILGQVYERFLGKVIRLTAGHQARVEEKPEVRKAGGVYYTPTYIVEYIVRNTLGELLKERDPESLERAPLRVLDPACGSGSFLLGAYQHLLDWHLSWYAQHEPEKWARGRNPAVFQARNGWQLTMEKKKEILTRHIFGVDIDAQAVEVTKLSLLLKVVENPGQLSLMGERILPDLGENIRCGNSLIGPDYYEGRQMAMFDQEERDRINDFDWNNEFSAIFKHGGFDVVIGNPPWGANIDKELEYFHNKYPDTTQEHTDSCKLFIDRAISLTASGGFTSMIVPNTILRQNRLKDVRHLLLQNQIVSILDLGENVFKNVVAPSCVFVVRRQYPGKNNQIRFLNLTKYTNSQKALLLLNNNEVSASIDQDTFSNNSDYAFVLPIKKISSQFKQLDEFTSLVLKDAGINYQRVKVGMQEKGKSDLSSRLLYEGVKQNDSDVMFWKGSDIDRYWIKASTQRYCRTNYKKFLKPNEVVHLNKKIYDLVPKILFRQTADKIIATIDYKGVWFGRSIITLIPNNLLNYKLEYFLGLLNSKYLNYLYNQIAQESGRVFAQVKLTKVNQLPIRIINFNDSTDVGCHHQMVSLVENMLALHRQLAAARLPDDKERLQRQIQATDRQIDRLVYELYGLTEEEIRIVEGEG